MTEEGSEKVTERVTRNVTEDQRKILEEITKDKCITTKRLSITLGIFERKIKENIKKLKQKEII